MSTLADLPASAVRKFSPKPTIEAEGLLTRQIDRAEITWIVPSADLTAFLNAVAGSAVAIPGQNTSIFRVVPLQHPEYPWMLADGFRAERVGWQGSASFYSHSFVTVRFRSPTWDLDGANAFLTIRQDPVGRWLTCKSAITTFTDGTTHPSSDPGIWVPGTKLSITVHQLPFLPNASVYPIQRATNDAELFGWPAGTLLYQAPGLVRNTTMAGVTTYEVDQELLQSAIPWNQEYRDDGVLDDIYVNGALRYPPMDLTKLFFL